MVKRGQEEQINQARQLIELGDFQKAKLILQPLVEQENPEAIFLRASFSIADEESQDDFERRHFKMLTQAAQLEFPAAIYALACCYDSGDMVGRDPEYAALLFKRSAEAGYPRAKLHYGLDLIYGSNGVAEDKTLGLIMLKQAVDEGVDGAAEELKDLQERGSVAD